MTIATPTGIQQLQLAYFGRPSDPAALTAWPTSGLSIEAIVLQFVRSAEYQRNTVDPNSTANAGGSRTFNDTNLINSFYLRLFGRLAVGSEVAGWTSALARGEVNYDYLGLTILNAGLNLPTTGAAGEMRAVLVAKVQSNDVYTGILYNNPASAAAYSTAAAIQDGIAYSSVTTTSTPQTLVQAQAAVATMVTSSGAGGGQTFTLTTNSDVTPGLIGSNGTTSTSGNDIVNGLIATGSQTLNTFDNLNLGSGTNTLNVRVAGLAGALAATPLLQNATIVNLINQDASANTATVDLSSATGTTTVQFLNTNAASDSIVLNAAANTAVILNNADASAAGGTASINLQGAAGRTGTSDAISLGFLNGSGTSTAFADLQIVAADGAAADATFEVGNVTVSGAASYVAMADGSANFRTFTVTGATTADTDGYGLTLTGAADFAQLRTVNASAMTGGGINITTTGVQNLTFTGSAGNDRLNITGGIANINALDVFTFGAGTNTLAIGTNTDIAAYTAGQLTVLNAYTDLQALEFTAAAAAAGSTLDVSDFTRVNSFTLSGGANAAAATGVAQTITGVTTSEQITVSASLAPVVQAAAAVAGAAAAVGFSAIGFTGDVVGQTATLNLTGGVAITGQFGQGNTAVAANTEIGGAGASAISFGGNITTLTINSTGTTANTIRGGNGGATARDNAGAASGAGGSAIANGAAVQSVVITGSQDLTIGGGVAGTGAANTAVGAFGVGFTAAVNVNASALTGKLTITGSAANDIIAGGTGADTITGANGADRLIGNGGADNFVYTVLTESLAGAGATTLGDTITDFLTGTDKFDVNAPQVAAIASNGGLRQGATYTAVGTGNLGTDIGTAIGAGANGVMIANGAAVVTITGTSAGTYLVLNDANAAFAAAADAVILLGGTSSTTLAATDFV